MQRVLFVRSLSVLMAMFVLSVNSTHARADVILSWDSTVFTTTGGFLGTTNEAVQMQIHVSGTSVSSQVWTASDFLKYRLEGASGWWFESQALSAAHSGGLFATDAAGNMVIVSSWGASHPVNVTTSWAGTNTHGDWYNIGPGPIAASYDTATSSIQLNNFGSESPSGWTASVATVPEPSSLMMVGLVGCVGIRRRRRTTRDCSL